MLNSILYLAVFALVIYAFAVLISPRPKDVALFDSEGTDEVTDADFPNCENGGNCDCRNK